MIFEALCVVAVVIIIARLLGVPAWIANFFKAKEPTFHAGDRVIYRRVYYYAPGVILGCLRYDSVDDDYVYVVQDDVRQEIQEVRGDCIIMNPEKRKNDDD